jgi:hypothetical protein
MAISWTCGCCGRTFDTLLLDLAFDAPAYWRRIPAEERSARTRLDADACTIDDRHFFIRACLEIPVHGLDQPFVWGVWVSLSEASMRRAAELFHVDADEDEPPRFGWLSNSIPGYPDTLSLKASVRFRSRTLRPVVELEPIDHPLALEQQEGISVERVQEIIRPMTHQ